MSSPVTAAAPASGTLARQFTEPLRELSVLALLAGNAVFLFLGFSDLFFVIDRWASDFGQRCAAVFSTFVGPVSLGLPIVALLLATHVAPMIRRSRPVLIAVLAELGVSALFGAITFLGAFAHGLPSARETIEGTLWRVIWLGFLVLACVLAVRLWLGLYPGPKPDQAGYPRYRQPSYGQPYPGEPMYPQSPHSFPAGTASVPVANQATYPAGSPASPPASSPSSPSALVGPTPVTGWPLVPPPPRPGPLVVSPGEPTADPMTDPAESTGEPDPAAGPTDGSAIDGPTVVVGPVETPAELTRQMPMLEDPTQAVTRPADPASGEPATKQR